MISYSIFGYLLAYYFFISKFDNDEAQNVYFIQNKPTIKDFLSSIFITGCIIGIESLLVKF